MKRTLILTLVMVMGLGLATMAGPLAGIHIVPTLNSTAALVAGWDFGNTAVECSKTDFAMWSGNWTIAALWTPSHETFSYRIGPKLLWDWKPWGVMQYKGLALVLGAAKTWGAFQLFAEFDLEATGILRIKPLVGVNIIFAEFFLSPVENKSLNLE
jgi:hypothetical protein